MASATSGASGTILGATPTPKISQGVSTSGASGTILGANPTPKISQGVSRLHNQLNNLSQKFSQYEVTEQTFLGKAVLDLFQKIPFGPLTSQLNDPEKHDLKRFIWQKMMPYAVGLPENVEESAIALGLLDSVLNQATSDVQKAILKQAIINATGGAVTDGWAQVIDELRQQVLPSTATTKAEESDEEEEVEESEENREASESADEAPLATAAQESLQTRANRELTVMASSDIKLTTEQIISLLAKVEQDALAKALPAELQAKVIELNKPVPQPVVIPVVVKAEVTENTLAALKTKLDELYAKLAEQNKSITALSGEYGKLTNQLLPSHDDYEAHKKEAVEKVPKYKQTFNTSVELSAAIVGEKENIAKTKEDLKKNLDASIEVIRGRRAHLEHVFGKLTPREEELAKISLGVDTGVRGKLGIASGVLKPITDTNYYKERKLAEDQTTTKISAEAFSFVFGKMNESFAKYQEFIAKLEKHLAKVSRLNNSINDNDPNLAAKKEQGKTLVETYKDLHDDGLDQLKVLDDYIKQLEEIRVALNQQFENQTKELDTKQTDLETIMKGLEDTLLKLLQKLAGTTVEKFEVRHFSHIFERNKKYEVAPPAPAVAAATTV